MARKLVFAAVTALLSFSSLALAADEVNDKDVHVLTTENFDKFIKDNPVSLIEFYAPWCGHCKSLAPHYAEAATRLKESGGIPLAKVDATQEGDLATKYEIKGYPTLKLFKNGEPMNYTGGRTADTIIQWIESATGPAVEIVESESKVETPQRGVVFVAKLKAKDNDAAKTYEKVAEARRMSAKFQAVVDASHKNEIVARRADEDPITTTIGSEEELLKWVDEEQFPFFGPIDGENHAAYDARTQEMVWFAGKDEEYQKFAPAIREAAKKFRADYSFVWLDSERFGTHAENGLGLTDLPGMVLRLREGGRYVYPKEKGFTGSEIIKFFTDVKAGKIEKFLKSDPIPEENDAPVKVVVGKNFEEIVFSKDKDVMLEIYAPWCGHCKRLAPIYDELAEKLSGVSHVVIAKMDGTTNEPPSADFNFRGFPTLFWLKAGEKTPVTYNEARTLEAMVEFIKANSSKPVNVTIEKDADDEASKDEL